MGTAMETAPMSMAGFAGTWNVNVIAENSDSVVSTHVLTATADSAGWSFQNPSAGVVPVRVVGMAGDSVRATAGPFASSVRRGMQVTIETLYRLQGDKLVGNILAHYVTSGADSVRRFRIEGTKQ